MTDKGKQQLRRWERRIQAALSLFPSSSDADDIIGLLSEEVAGQYNKLGRAAEALTQMLWAVAQANGARKTDKVLGMWARGQLVLLTLVHYAFALGVQWGRADGGIDRS